MDDVLVLWDIDGTLLNAGGVGRDLYSTVFVQLFGRSLSAYAPMAGRTDRAIILETLTLAGVDEPRRYVDPFIAGLSSQAMAMRAAVATQGQPLPGAAEALAALASAWSLDPVGFLDPARAAADGGHSGPGDAGVPAIPGGSGPGGSGSGGPGSGGPGSASVALAERLTPDMAMATTATMIAKEMPDGVAMPSELPDALPPGGLPPTGLPPTGLPPDGLPRRVHQSVLTGNVRQLAEVKLDALGLRNGLDLCIGAYGEDHEDRAQLVHVARRRAAGVHGRSADAFDGTATVVIGDTPLDILAALDAGARAVGVATGSFAAADLMAAGAHAVLPDLTDTRLVLQTLLALYTGTSPDRAGRRDALAAAGSGGAGGGAGLQCSPVAACAQRIEELCRRLARGAGDVVPAVAERAPGGHGGFIVAAPVAVAGGAVLMEPLAVKLHHQAVLVVAAVAVAPRPVRFDERHLPAGGRQAMGTLNVPVVPIFQRRMRARGGQRDDLVEPIAPAKLLPRGHDLPEARFAGQLPLESSRDPSHGVVETGRRADQVGDRFLDPGMRRNAAREPPARLKVRRAVNDDAPHRANPPLGGNRDVYDRGPRVAQPQNLGGCLMTELRTLTRMEQGGP
jgi:phosphoglycolate phosphatase-like HAD superfamily hydrolase